MTIHSYEGSCSPEAKAALATLTEVIAEGAVTRYVARPGRQQEFMSLDMALLPPYTLYQTADRSCVALVHSVSPDAWQGGPDEGSQEGPSARSELWCAHYPCRIFLQAIDAAMRQGGVGPLLELGLAPAQAQLLSLVQPGRQKALHQLETELVDIMRGYAKKHGELLHLHFIATRPSARGQGLGSRMLAHLGQIADMLGVCMYLEASSQALRRLYARHGFRDVRTFQLGEAAGGGPGFHIMLRQPAGAAWAAGETLAT